MLVRVAFLTILPGCFLLSSCHQASSRSAYPAAPAGSYRLAQLDMLVDNASRSISGAFVTTHFNDSARAQPMIGRYFVDDDYQQTNHDVAVLSNKCWRQQFGSSPEIIGRDLQLSGRPHTVIGVMPKGFNVPEGVDVFLPEKTSSR